MMDYKACSVQAGVRGWPCAGCGFPIAAPLNDSDCFLGYRHVRSSVQEMPVQLPVESVDDERQRSSHHVSVIVVGGSAAGIPPLKRRASWGRAPIVVTSDNHP